MTVQRSKVHITHAHQRVDGGMCGGPTARGCANSFHALFMARCCTLVRRSGCDANKRPRESVTVGERPYNAISQILETCTHCRSTHLLACTAPLVAIIATSITSTLARMVVGAAGIHPAALPCLFVLPMREMPMRVRRASHFCSGVTRFELKLCNFHG